MFPTSPLLAGDHGTLGHMRFIRLDLSLSGLTKSWAGELAWRLRRLTNLSGLWLELQGNQLRPRVLQQLLRSISNLCAL